MRKNVFLSVLFLLFCVGSSQAQPGTVLKVNPLSLTLATLNVQAERVLNERFSVQLGVYFGGGQMPFRDASVTDNQLRHFGITPEIRFHTSFEKLDCPEGFYFAPFLRFRRIVQTYEAVITDPDSLASRGDIVTRRNNLGGGVLFGYEFILGDHFALDLFIGPQFSVGRRQLEIDCDSCNGNETSRPTGLDRTGLELRAGVCIGYAF